MITVALILGFSGLTAAIFCGLYRLARGPTVMDRILAFEIIATCAVGMVVLLSIAWRTALYVELILIFSLLGFVGTVALLAHLHRTYALEADEAEERAAAAAARAEKKK
jgi:multisubunit Na+/H+ antiporter MnhF subunit